MVVVEVVIVGVVVVVVVVVVTVVVIIPSKPGKTNNNQVKITLEMVLIKHNLCPLHLLATRVIL